MPDSGAKYVVQFVAEMKELRKAMQELKGFDRQTTKQTQVTAKEGRKNRAEQKKDLADFSKKQQAAHKLELTHLKKARGEEQKRFKERLRGVEKAHALEMRGQKKILADQRKQERDMGRAAGPGARTGFTRGTAMVAAGTMVANAVSGLWSFFSGAMIKGYQQFMQYQQSLGQTAGLGAGRQIRAGVRGAMGGRLGFSMIDTAQQVPMMARATGVLGPRELQQAQRATGMDAGEVAGLFGALRRSGTDFAAPGQFGGAGPTKGQSAGGREFQRLIAAGMASGLEKARVPEFLEGISQMTERAGSQTFGAVNVESLATQLAALGRTGLPGLQGGRGAAALQQILGGISAPGGGEWGQAFMQRAFGFGKPGGRSTFFEAEIGRERASRGEDPKAMMKVIGETIAEHGGGEEGALALRELTKVSLDQAKTLLEIFGSGKSQEEQQAAVADEMKKSEPLEKQSLEAMKDVGGGVKRIAALTDRGIGMGAKAASTIEAMEDLQYKVLVKILEAIEFISGFIKEHWPEDSAKVVKDLVKTSIAPSKLVGMSAAEAAKNIGESTVEAAGAATRINQGFAGFGTPTAQYQQQVGDARAEYQKRAAAAQALRQLQDAGVQKIGPNEAAYIRQAQANAANIDLPELGAPLDVQDEFGSFTQAPGTVTIPKAGRRGGQPRSTTTDVRSLGEGQGPAASSEKVDIILHLPHGTVAQHAPGPAKSSKVRVSTTTSR